MATVMRSTGSWYDLWASGGVFRARLRGKLRLAGSRSTNPVVVGDVVEVDREGDEYWIAAVMPRRNYVIRRSTNLSRESHIIAANLDQALVVASLREPRTSYEFIDRFLVTCEAYGVPATVVLNKVDLLPPDEVSHFVGVYGLAGYRVILASGTSGEGVGELGEFLRGRTTLVSGNSGVGKSTLIGAVSPGLDIRTGAVSRAHGKGMHTTTFSTMYLLDSLANETSSEVSQPAAPPSGGLNAQPLRASGTFVIDTPGVKGFGLIGIEPAELARYFPEMLAVSGGCGYYNCTHTHEPDCAVMAAVERGEIAQERYVSYLKMLEEDGKHR